MAISLSIFSTHIPNRSHAVMPPWLLECADANIGVTAAATVAAGVRSCAYRCHCRGCRGLRIRICVIRVFDVFGVGGVVGVFKWQSSFFSC